MPLQLFNGDQLAVIGDNAAGKSRLLETPGVFGDRNVQYLSFMDAYGAMDGQYYYQLRWNQQAIDEDTPTAGALLDRTFRLAENRASWTLSAGECARLSAERSAMRSRLVDLFCLQPVLDKYVITLSSGELRKFQITRALLNLPEVLVIDNPFIGLDAATRDRLSDLLAQLVRETGLQVVLVMPRVDVMPSFITHVVRISGGEAVRMPVEEYSAPLTDGGILPADAADAILSLPHKNLADTPFYPGLPGSEIVRCNSVTIRYGERTILRDFDWTVREGERWAVSGENGAGKSTLLSLICADNPQSYACDIELFGHRRGSGESIWEIKKHIGYVSPEMHRSYQKNISALDIVASGLFDTVGLFMHPDGEQYELCREWMRIFGIEDLAGRSYLRLSSGEQRLCLLARAFVKDPELLILDEPLHGLDARRSEMVRSIIDTFMQRPHKTLMMVTHYESELPSCIDRRLHLVRN